MVGFYILTAVLNILGGLYESRPLGLGEQEESLGGRKSYYVYSIIAMTPLNP